MVKIFFSLFFLLISFPINLDRLQINILPESVGYVLLLMGLNELCYKGGINCDKRLPKVLSFFILFSFVDYLLVALRIGIIYQFGEFNYAIGDALSLLMLIGTFILLQKTIEYICKFQDIKHIDLQIDKLNKQLIRYRNSLYIGGAAIILLAIITLIGMDNGSMLFLVSGIVGITGFVVLIVFQLVKLLLFFGKAAKVYSSSGL